MVQDQVPSQEEWTNPGLVIRVYLSMLPPFALVMYHGF